MVLGGRCYRPFEEQKFGAIGFSGCFLKRTFIRIWHGINELDYRQNEETGISIFTYMCGL